MSGFLERLLPQFENETDMSIPDVIGFRRGLVDRAERNSDVAGSLMYSDVIEVAKAIVEPNDFVLADLVKLEEAAQAERDAATITRGMVAGNSIGLGLVEDTAQILKQNDALAKELATGDNPNVALLDDYREAKRVQDQMAAEARNFLDNNQKAA